MKRIFAVLLVVVLAGCARERQIVIVSTNDIHSSIDNFPRLATLVESLRAETGGNVLLVDAGDRWTGNPFVDKAPEPLSPIVELMNELGYDIATLGNHEFDWGQARLRERLDQAEFPVVCANISSRGSELGYIPPYAFIDINGVRFAFLGLVHNFTSQHRPEGKNEHFVGLSFPDVYATAREYAWLADSCNVFVGLTHIGHDRDLILAEEVPELDLIVGGHTHTDLKEPAKIGDVFVTQAGGKLEYAGVTTVTKTRGGVTIENNLVRLDTIAPMPWYEKMVAGYNSNPRLLAPIGETAAPLGRAGVKNLVTDAIRESVGADVVFYHSGGIRIDTLSGVISTADLYRIEPFLSEVYTLRMTPGQIKGMVLARWNDPISPAHGPDIMPSGVGYSILTNEAGDAVDVTFDRPERASYFVAMPDYLYKNYAFDRPAALVETGRQVTEMLQEYIVRHNPVEADNVARITIK